MKRLLTTLAFFGVFGAVYASEIKFEENPGIFQNPGQGWTRWGQHPGYSKADVNYGAGYNRYSWAELNPAEGEYNWALIDRALENFSRAGLPFYFRIMCVNTTGYPPKYSVPGWVFDKGAKFFFNELKRPPNERYPDGKVEVAVPDFADPLFLEEHEKFIAALAERYDSDPRVGGLDIGSYGNWGEWHCTFLGLDTRNGRRPHSFEVRKRYADMYLKNFKKTQLAFMTDDEEVFAYALGKGKIPRVGIRRDGVGSPWHFNRWIGTPPYDKIARMGDVWKDRPVFLEFMGTVENFKKNGWDIAHALKWTLKNHVSLVNEVPLFPERIDKGSEAEKALRLVDLYAGARLVPESAEVSYSDGKLDVTVRGENRGASRIYLPYRMRYELRDSSGKVVFDMLSSQDPRKILPGKFGFSDSARLSLKPGETYSLSLRVFHTKKVFRDFRFAVKNLNPDGSLDLGKISVK